MLGIGFMAGRNQQYTTVPKNVEYQNHVMGLNFIALEAGDYSFPVEIANPYNTTTIRIYSFLFSDPEDLRNYVAFSCSVENGTKLNPLQSVNATFSLEVQENPYQQDGEFYVRVGCLRIGEEI